MKKRLGTVPLLVATAAVALVVGSVGSATASSLTRSEVKKVAAKVVKKQAPRLSVAHAATADSSTSAASLQGYGASQLRTTAYRYLLPAQTAATLRNFAFPGLPDGNYLVSYSYLADTESSATIVSCVIFPSTGARSLAPSTAVNASAVRARGSSVASLTAGSGLSLSCSSTGGSFSMDGFGDNTVTFIPLDTVISGTPTVS